MMRGNTLRKIRRIGVSCENSSRKNLFSYFSFLRNYAKFEILCDFAKLITLCIFCRV
jgi:hypothetical protein